jgi:excinuclease ABC subunit C
MYEVLSRRLRRARELAKETDEALARGEPDPGEGSGWKLPDLIVVDGGKGQLGMALAAARDVGIDLRPGSGLPIIALAKERESEAAAAAVTPAEVTPAEVTPAPPPAPEPKPEAKPVSRGNATPTNCRSVRRGPRRCRWARSA